MGFKYTFLYSAIIIFIISLVSFAYMFYRSQRQMQWPPTVGTCPDYWWVQEDDKGNKVCKNMFKLGNCSKKTCHEMSFDDVQYSGPSGYCEKQKWAKLCNLTWDGITNVDHQCDIEQL